MNRLLRLRVRASKFAPVLSLSRAALLLPMACMMMVAQSAPTGCTPGTAQLILWNGTGLSCVQADPKQLSITQIDKTHFSIKINSTTPGPIGPQGPAGPQGLAGLAGLKGVQGPAGPQGATGLQGPTGLQGVAGVKGATGAQGAIGSQGPAGPQGLAGAKGPAGPQGLQGVPGPAGISATVTVGTVTTLQAGASATVTETGTPQAVVLNFGIPQGSPGGSAGSGSGSGSAGSPPGSGTGSGAGSGSGSGAPPVNNPNQPALPQTTPRSTMPSITGRRIALHSDDDLQSALNQANCGDALVLDAGATWTGNYAFPAKNCSDANWVIVTTSAAASLPAAGIRVTSSDLPNMATVCTASSNPVLANDGTSANSQQAAFYWFEGIHVGPCPGFNTTLWNAIIMTAPNGKLADRSVPTSVMPHDIAFSHSYISGIPQQDSLPRGIYFDGYNFTLIDSQVVDFQSSWQDSQTLLSDCGGPGWLIQNNELDAAADALLFAAPQCATVPSDITIRGNHSTKPAYQNAHIISKNFIEFKNGVRILIEGNVMEGFNNTPGQQIGAGIMLTPRSETGGEPAGTWATVAQVSDVTVRSNVVHDTGLGINVAAGDGICVNANVTNCLISHRTLVQNNLIYNIDIAGSYNWGMDLDSPRELTIDHNTVVSNNFAFFMDSYPSVNGTVTNNIFSQQVAGQGLLGPIVIAGNDGHFVTTNTGGLVANNGGFGAAWSQGWADAWNTTQNTSGTLFSSTNPFAETTTYSLQSGSVFKKAGTDGLDLGWTNPINVQAVVTGRTH